MSATERFLRIAGKCGRMAGRAVRRISGRSPVIASGPGKGLSFDAGPSGEGFLTGEYEGPVQEAIASMAREGDVFYDIGANLGYFSILAARLVGASGAVYAFEPVPANAAAVGRNARLNRFGNIVVLEVAVSRRTGRSELYLARHVGGAALKSAGVPPDLAGSIAVDTSSIDDLVSFRRIRPPDVVKIDVEGAELDVLQGMRTVLRESNPGVILEVDDADKTRCEEKMEACLEFLRGLQYGVEILPHSYKDGNWFVRHIVARREPPLAISAVSPAVGGSKVHP
jgi:FkbM family methyltransferase